MISDQFLYRSLDKFLKNKTVVLSYSFNFVTAGTAERSDNPYSSIAISDKASLHKGTYIPFYKFGRIVIILMCTYKACE